MLGLAVFMGMISLAANVANADNTTLYGGFDLVVFGNMTGQGDVEGSAIIGGNLGGNSANFATQLSGQPASNVNLYVGGNVTAGENLDNGSAIVGGTVNPSMNVNQSGGTVTKNDPTAVSAILTPLESSLKNASAIYAGMGPTGNATIVNSGGTTTLKATGSVTGSTVVFDVTDSSFFTSNTNIDLDSSLEPASAVIINVGLTSTALTIGSSIHFSAPTALESTVIWNFYDLSGPTSSISLNTQSEFTGAILAPYSTFSNSSPVDGSVAVDVYNQNAEIHLPASTVNPPGVGGSPPSAPLPASLGLAVSGLIATALVRRAKRANWA